MIPWQPEATICCELAIQSVLSATRTFQHFWKQLYPTVERSASVILSPILSNFPALMQLCQRGMQYIVLQCVCVWGGAVTEDSAYSTPLRPDPPHPKCPFPTFKPPSSHIPGYPLHTYLYWLTQGSDPALLSLCRPSWIYSRHKYLLAHLQHSASTGNATLTQAQVRIALLIPSKHIFWN